MWTSLFVFLGYKKKGRIDTLILFTIKRYERKIRSGVVKNPSLEYIYMSEVCVDVGEGGRVLRMNFFFRHERRPDFFWWLIENFTFCFKMQSAF